MVSVRVGFLQPGLHDLKDEAGIKAIATFPPGCCPGFFLGVSRRLSETGNYLLQTAMCCLFFKLSSQNCRGFTCSHLELSLRSFTNKPSPKHTNLPACSHRPRPQDSRMSGVSSCVLPDSSCAWTGQRTCRHLVGTMTSLGSPAIGLGVSWLPVQSVVCHLAS